MYSLKQLASDSNGRCMFVSPCENPPLFFVLTSTGIAFLAYGYGVYRKMSAMALKASTMSFSRTVSNHSFQYCSPLTYYVPDLWSYPSWRCIFRSAYHILPRAKHGGG